MSVAKVIELHAEGATVEAAVEEAVRQASKTIDHIRHVYIEGIQAIVENNTIDRFRVNVKVTFVVQ